MYTTEVGSWRYALFADKHSVKDRVNHSGLKTFSAMHGLWGQMIFYVCHMVTQYDMSEWAMR